MHPITMYSSNWCGFCRAAKALLKERGLEFQEIDVTADPNRKMEMMERSGRRTVPQIFFGDEHIGGYTDLRDYFEEQEL